MKSSDMKLPDVLIVGAQKAGTTSIYDWLGQHPAVYANPAAKDCPFFCDDTKYAEGIGAYASLFEDAEEGQLILAGGVNYMFFPNAPSRIFSSIPQVKIIFSLRNPIDRAFSAYRHAVERGLEKRSFDQAVEEELSSPGYATFFENSRKNYLSHGLYAAQIARFQGFFPHEAMKIVLFDDIKSRPQSVIDEVFAFIGLPSFMPNMIAKNVTKGGYKSDLLRRALFDENLRKNRFFSALKNLLNPEIRHKLRTAIREFNKKPVKFDEPSLITRQLLTDYYREEISRLETLISRNLGHWFSAR